MLGQQHTFVDDGATRQAGDVEDLRSIAGTFDVFLGQATDDEQLALEVKAGAEVGQAWAAADEYLTHDRLTGGGRRPQRAIVGRHIAPAEEHLPFGGHQVSQGLLAHHPPR